MYIECRCVGVTVRLYLHNLHYRHIRKYAYYISTTILLLFEGVSTWKCTRTYLRESKIQKKFLGGIPPDHPRCNGLSHITPWASLSITNLSPESFSRWRHEWVLPVLTLPPQMWHSAPDNSLISDNLWTISNVRPKLDKMSSWKAEGVHIWSVIRECLVYCDTHLMPTKPYVTHLFQ